MSDGVSLIAVDTLYLMCPPIAAAILAYSVMGRLLPTADTGLLAIACWLLNTTYNKNQSAEQPTTKRNQ